MIDYQIVSQPKCRKVEHRYLYVWEEPFSVIDARFIPFDCSRKAAINGVRLATYKLMAINTNINSAPKDSDVINHIEAKVYFSMRLGKRASIHSRDIEEIVMECFLTEPPEYIAKNIITTKRVEWKSNWMDLIQFSTEQKKKMNSLGDDEKMSYEFKIIGEQKRKYAMECMSFSNGVLIVDKVREAMDSWLETNAKEDITYNYIAKELGHDVTTIKKYLKDAKDIYDFLELQDDARRRWRKSNDAKLVNSCYIINERGKKITKVGLSNESGLSRQTVYNKWNDRDLKLNTLVESLNSKL